MSLLLALGGSEHLGLSWGDQWSGGQDRELGSDAPWGEGKAPQGCVGGTGGRGWTLRSCLQ